MEQTAGSKREGLAKVPEAAAFLGIGKSKIYAMMDAGELRFTKLGSARRIPWRALYEIEEKAMQPA